MDVGSLLYYALQVPLNSGQILLNMLLPTSVYTFVASIAALSYEVVAWSLFILAPLIYSLGWDQSAFGTETPLMIVQDSFFKLVSFFLNSAAAVETLMYQLGY